MPLAMTRKRKPAVLTLILVRFLTATARAQDSELLVFDGPRALPACAHGCQDLYSARYECPPGGNRVGCFCGTRFISSKPEGWACDESCTAEADRAQVLRFLDTTCGDSDADGDTGEPTTEKDGPGQSKNTGLTDEGNRKDPQAEKAVSW